MKLERVSGPELTIQQMRINAYLWYRQRGYKAYQAYALAIHIINKLTGE